MISLKQVSSLEKILLKSEFDADEIGKIRCFSGERVSYQIAYRADKLKDCKFELISDINEHIKVYSIGSVPVDYPAQADAFSDENYISFEPTIYPDVLYPFTDGDLSASCWYKGMWITVDDNAPSGRHKITVRIFNNDEYAMKEMEIEIFAVSLPPQKVIFTQWLHADCIAEHYKLEVFSEEHWQMLEKFIKMAADNGVNMMLTPIFTPPLDTKIGGERPTVQLIDVKKAGNKYEFNFDKLKRWINICKKCGIKYFEMSHLFTQWGAEFTPKIVASSDGVEKRIFGWDVASTDESYALFLSQMLPALVDFLRTEGVADNTYFHVSDEPSENHLDSYMNAKAQMSKYLRGFKIIDALSDYSYYVQGIVENPIVATDHVEPFIGNVKNLWVYYCCAECQKVSNRFIAMPSCRNRSIAVQLYKFNVEGFLHWGYNFYHSFLSLSLINPFCDTSAGGYFPSGDSFSVYPGSTEPLPSIRLAVFYEALQDVRAMQLLEQYIGHDETVKFMEDICGEIRFDKCFSDAKALIELREKINSRIIENCGLDA